MNLKPLLLVGLCLLMAGEETVCVHPTVGSSVRVSLENVRKAQRAVKEKLAFATEKAGKLTLDTPFESGLPACRRHETRVVRTSVPRELVGKSIVFAPADRLPRADFRVATSARRIVEIEADALAHPALAERLGVRCAPTLVRVRSEVELELVEDP
jgi:hypothetical protein